MMLATTFPQPQEGQDTSTATTAATVATEATPETPTSITATMASSIAALATSIFTFLDEVMQEAEESRQEYGQYVKAQATTQPSMYHKLPVEEQHSLKLDPVAEGAMEQVGSVEEEDNTLDHLL